MAPSPQKVIATRGSPRRLKASAAPTTSGQRLPSIETSGKTPFAGAPKCMLPSRPRRRAVRPAEEVREDVGHRHPAGEVAGQLAVERRDDVVRPEREPRPGGHGLLHAPGVDAAGDPALAVERHDALLRQALEEHQPEQLEPVSRARHSGAALAGSDVRLSSQAAPRGRPGLRHARLVASSSSGANGTGVSGGATSDGRRVEQLERFPRRRATARVAGGAGRARSPPGARAGVRSSRPSRGSPAGRAARPSAGRGPRRRARPTPRARGRRLRAYVTTVASPPVPRDPRAADRRAVTARRAARRAAAGRAPCARRREPGRRPRSAARSRP